MLPSKVREYLSRYLFEKLESAKLNYLGDPVCELVDIIGEFRDIDGVHTAQVIELYEAALAKYNKKHPKCWDNEKQQAFRA
jgi:hypothetical protein